MREALYLIGSAVAIIGVFLAAVDLWGLTLVPIGASLGLSGYVIGILEDIRDALKG